MVFFNTGNTLSATETDVNRDVLIVNQSESLSELGNTNMAHLEVINANDMTIEKFEKEINNPKFKQSLLIEKDAVMLKIEDTTLLLSSFEEAQTVVEKTIEQLMASEHYVSVFVNIVDHKLTDIEFEHQSDLVDVCDAELVSIDVMESVELVATKVTGDKILTVEEAVEITTKSKDAEVIYKVKSGDVPSLIAQNNQMPLSMLYVYNPSLEDGSRPLQIGEELVVLVPKPEMTLKVIEMASYQASIPKGTISQRDDSNYVGTVKTIDKGSDGIKEVTAEVSKINGNEVSRSITGERTLQEPISAVVTSGTKALPVKGAVGNYIYPLTDYSLTSTFGSRWGRQHTGIDFAASTGTNVRASNGGVVVFSGWNDSYGYVITIDHGNGVQTKYAHNSELLVSSGETVSQYQVIAKVGNTGNSTGSHCHFELLIDGTPVNPLKYLQ